MDSKGKIRSRKQYGLILLAAACLSGCAGKDTGREDTGKEESVSEASQEASFDWYTQTFSVNGQIDENSALGIADFYLWEHEEEKEPDSFPQIFHGTDGTNFYTLKYVPDMEKGGEPEPVRIQSRRRREGGVHAARRSFGGGGGFAVYHGGVHTVPGGIFHSGQYPGPERKGQDLSQRVPDYPYGLPGKYSVGRGLAARLRIPWAGQ